MKKIFALILAWILVLPGFAAAADDVADNFRNRWLQLDYGNRTFLRALEQAGNGAVSAVRHLAR